MPRFPAVRRALLALVLVSACGGAPRTAVHATANTATCLETAAAIDARAHAGSLLALDGALAPLAPYYRSLATAVEAACSAGAWSPEVRGCMVAATSTADLRTCEDALSLDQRHTLATRLANVTDRSIGGERRAPADREPAHDGDGDEIIDTGVPECDEFLAMQDRYFACDKVPAQAKDAMKQSMDQQKQAWSMLKDPNVPIEALHAAADGCRQGTDALKQSATAMGCSL